jgi:hypothetical protein
MALAERAAEIIRGLPRDWERARLDLTVEEADEADRAALILAPATPGRADASFTLHVHDGTKGLAPTPETVKRVLSRLDEAGIRGRLRLAAAERPPAEAAAAVPAKERATLAASWDALVRRLPPDWSDLYGEIELDSSDFLDRGALLLAPINPARSGASAGFRFRAARSKGYGVAPVMARRAFARLDEERLTGRLRILRVLSDTNAPFSQGPVWREDGRAV